MTRWISHRPTFFPRQKSKSEVKESAPEPASTSRTSKSIKHGSHKTIRTLHHTTSTNSELEATGSLNFDKHSLGVSESGFTALTGNGSQYGSRDLLGSNTLPGNYNFNGAGDPRKAAERGDEQGRELRSGRQEIRQETSRYMVQ